MDLLKLGTCQQAWWLQPGQRGEAMGAQQALSTGIGIANDGKRFGALPSPAASAGLQLPEDWVGLSCRVSFPRGKEEKGTF